MALRPTIWNPRNPASMTFQLFCFDYDIPQTPKYYMYFSEHIKFRLYFFWLLFGRGKQAILTCDLPFRVGRWSRSEPARALHAVSEAGLESRTLILLTWLWIFSLTDGWRAIISIIVSSFSIVVLRLF